MSLVASFLLIAGCGGGEDFANEPRPPVMINVTAAITDDQLTVDPPTFGAGPVTILITNLTQEAQRLTVETDVLGADDPGVRQQTAPINPGGTATLKLDMPTGRYRVSVDGGSIPPAAVRVGPRRESSQDVLLQP